MIQRNYLEQTAPGKKILNIEYKLILFFLYIGYLIFLLIKGSGLKTVIWTHVLFVFIFSVFYFGRQFIYILFAPVIAIITPFENYRIKRYLKNFSQNQASGVAIVLAHSNWTMLEAWIKPNFCLEEIKILIKYLKTKKQNFSFYPNASIEEVERIMSDKNTNEVYFWGHGSSHTFQLNTDDILYYCEFNNLKYGKNFVHQVHCGTKDGKSLIDYVVPEKNKLQCFLIRKTITGLDIIEEYKKKIKQLEKDDSKRILKL